MGAHDIVINQAIKNLRYINRKILATELREHSKKAEIKYCWKDDKISDHNSFIDAIASFERESKIRFSVIIIQPHTTKSYYTQNAQSAIKKQLDVLLVRAEAAIKASEAEFYIIGHDDTQPQNQLHHRP